MYPEELGRPKDESEHEYLSKGRPGMFLKENHMTFKDI